MLKACSHVRFCGPCFRQFFALMSNFSSCATVPMTLYVFRRYHETVADMYAMNHSNHCNFSFLKKKTSFQTSPYLHKEDYMLRPRTSNVVRALHTFMNTNFMFFSLTYRQRQPVIKVNNFFEITAQGMSTRMFRRYFRMNQGSLENLTDYIRLHPLLYQHPSYERICVEKKLAMTTCYLGSSSTTIQ